MLIPIFLGISTLVYLNFHLVAIIRLNISFILKMMER
nr:MAG TPA: hypothetical protein [Caudoviricetes sp.]